MASLSLYTKLETLPSELKEEAKKFIDKLLKKTKESKESETQQKPGPRKFGSLKGKIHISDDFDAPLEDFKDYM